MATLDDKGSEVCVFSANSPSIAKRRRCQHCLRLIQILKGDNSDSPWGLAIDGDNFRTTACKIFSSAIHQQFPKER